MRIKKEQVIYALVALLLLTITAAFSLLYIAQQKLTLQMIEKQNIALSKLANLHLGSTIDHWANHVPDLAKQDEVTDYLAALDNDHPNAALQNTLEKRMIYIANRHAETHYVRILGTNGKELALVRKHKISKVYKDRTARPYFYGSFHQSQKNKVSAFFRTNPPNEAPYTVIDFSMPLFLKNRLIGVIAISYDFKKLIEIGKQLVIGKLIDNIYIYTQNGQILYATNPKLSLTELVRGANLPFTKLFPTTPGYHTKIVNGNVFVSTIIPKIHATLLIVTDRTTIDQKTKMFYRPMLYIAAGSLLLIVILSTIIVWLLTQEFRQRENYISNLLYLMQNMLVIVDQHTLIIERSNQSIQKTLEYHESELRGLPLVMLFESQKKYDQIIQDIRANTPIKNIEVNFKNKKNHTIPVLFSISFIEGSICCVAQDITDQKKTEEQLDFIARHDYLTMLPNRKALDTFFANEISRSTRHHLKFALLVADLNKFKDVNDTYGHEVGDMLLQEVANRLRNTVRQEDFICRTGGDEFLIALTHLPDALTAQKIADILIDAISKPYHIQQYDITISVSIGISYFPADSVDKIELQQKADQAMYQAKELQAKTAIRYTQLKP